MNLDENLAKWEEGLGNWGKVSKRELWNWKQERRELGD